MCARNIKLNNYSFLFNHPIRNGKMALDFITIDFNYK